MPLPIILILAIIGAAYYHSNVATYKNEPTSDCFDAQGNASESASPPGCDHLFDISPERLCICIGIVTLLLAIKKVFDKISKDYRPSFGV